MFNSNSIEEKLKLSLDEAKLKQALNDSNSSVSSASSLSATESTTSSSSSSLTSTATQSASQQSFKSLSSSTTSIANSLSNSNSSSSIKSDDNNNNNNSNINANLNDLNLKKIINNLPLKIQLKTTTDSAAVNNDTSGVSAGTQKLKHNFIYSKEFLQKVRNERSKFIEQIYPDIFKAYCYCMNGRYWNPEKYFDVVQYNFPSELDKIKKTKKNDKNYQANQAQKNRDSGNNNNNNRQTLLNHNNRPMNKNQNQNNTRNNKMKQEPKRQQQQKQSHQSTTITTLTTTTSDNIDKILLNLIKNESTTTTVVRNNEFETSSGDMNMKQVNFIDQLINKSSTSTSPEKVLFTNTAKSNNLLGLIKPPTATTTTCGHIVTAEELERALKLTTICDSKPQDAYNKFVNFIKPAECQQKPNTMNYEDKNSLLRQLILKTPPTETGFPLQNPHEKPFQDLHLHVENENALNQLLKLNMTNAPVVSTKNNIKSDCSSIENLFNKIKVKSSNENTIEQQQQHFNSLLNKITKPETTAKPQQQQQQQQQASILKWFTNVQTTNNSAQLNMLSLKDIETLHYY